MRSRDLAAAFAAMLAGAVAADAAVVATQSETRSHSAIWLMNLDDHQGAAHSLVYALHSVHDVAVFDTTTLSGVDVVYLSPANGQLGLRASEIDALEGFVNGGGRLILPADHSSAWTADLAGIAGRFGVSYGAGSLASSVTATVTHFANPITNGPAGLVNSFDAFSANDGLSSTNPEFLSLAEYPGHETALGYLPPGPGRLGDVVFLTDFNTFDDGRFGDLDSQALWANLFAPVNVPHPGGLALLGAGALWTARRRRRS